VVLAFAYCATMFLYAVPAGIFIGRNRLVMIAALTMGGTLLRVGYGFVLGWTSPDGFGALASSGLGMATVTLIAVVLLPRAQRHQPARIVQAVQPDTNPQHLRGRLSLTGEGAVGSLLSAALWGAWSLPLLFARHYLPAADAGVFAASQLIVSTILLFTSSLATAFYPAIVRSRARSHVIAGLAGTVGLALLCSAGAAVLGPPSSAISTGRASAAAGPCCSPSACR
jgi:O-antigen/teichoic acid export membrane protein